MSAPVCNECDNDIDTDNRRFPGYCSDIAGGKPRTTGLRCRRPRAITSRPPTARRSPPAHQALLHLAKKE